ncbi:MAG: hypothetical protein WCE21_05840 [Candidatus Babeliales bacterium]
MNKNFLKILSLVLIQCYGTQLDAFSFFRGTTDLPEATISDASKNLTRALIPKYPWQKVDDNKVTTAQTNFTTAAQSNPQRAGGALKVLVDKYQEEGIKNADDAAKLNMLYEVLLDTKPNANSQKTYRELIQNIIDEKPYYSEMDAINALLKNPLHDASKSISGNYIDKPHTSGDYLLNARMLLDAPEVDSLLAKAHYQRPSWFEEYRDAKLTTYAPESKAQSLAPKLSVSAETVPLTSANFEPAIVQKVSSSDIDIEMLPQAEEQVPPVPIVAPQESAVSQQKTAAIFDPSLQLPKATELAQQPERFAQLNTLLNAGLKEYADEIETYEKELEQRAKVEAQKKRKKITQDITYNEILKELISKSVTAEGRLLKAIGDKTKLNQPTEADRNQLKKQEQKTQELRRLFRVLDLLERASDQNKTLTVTIDI